MRAILRTACATVLVILLGGHGPNARAAEPPKDFEATLRKLEKDIAAVRGLEFKSPVVAKIIPRPDSTPKKLQGYYSIKDKALFLYDDLTGAYERGVLIHEMVHALQDQHFGLAKLHQTTFEGDADLARSALIEGDATFVMIELLKKDQPRVAHMLESPLDKARDVQNAFLYAQGARYVKALKERGGWSAVNAAYKFLPRSTAAILHPEGVKTIDLGPGVSRGELALLRMLTAHQETAPLATKAAAGWKADRELQENGVSSWVIAFQTNGDAIEFQQALVKLRTSQNPSWKKMADEASGTTWQDDKNGLHGILTRGDRVLVLDAPDAASYTAQLDRLEGPPVLEIYTGKDRQRITFGQMIDQLLAADLVCIGEKHDSDPQHRVQLQVIKALHARDERLGVGMEMFQRPFQKEIDRFFKGEANEETFLKATEYHQRWGFDWGLYRPIVEFCRRNNVPLAALNTPRELIGRLSRVGVAGLNEDETKQLGEIDFQVKQHRDFWFDKLAKMHGKAEATAEEKERSYQVMTVWDAYMAASAADFQQSRKLRRMVVLAGSGHIDCGFGIPQRAARLTGGKVVTLRIAYSGDKENDGPPVTDFLIIVK